MGSRGWGGGLYLYCAVDAKKRSYSEYLQHVQCCCAPVVGHIGVERIRKQSAVVALLRPTLKCVIIGGLGVAGNERCHNRVERRVVATLGCPTLFVGASDPWEHKCARRRYPQGDLTSTPVGTK